MRRRAESVQRLQAFADIPMAECIAIVSGALWDVTGVPALSFAPLAACAVALAAIAMHMLRRNELV